MPTHPQPPRRAIARRFGFALAALAGALALGELAGWPFLRSPLTQQLTQATGVPVQLDGRFRVRLIFAPQLSAERVTVGPGGSVDVPHLLQAQGLVLQWRWGDVWRASRGQPLHIKALQADAVDAHLVRLASGAASWQLGAAERPAIPASPAQLPTFDRLVLRSGDVVFRDEVLDMALKAHIAQDPSPTARLPWSAEAKGHYHQAPVTLKAQAAADLPLLLKTGAPAALTPLALNGQLGKTHVVFDGAVGALWDGEGVKGRLQMSGDSLQTSAAPLGVVLPDTPPYKIDARIAREGATWSVVTDTATVGRSALAADMQYRTDTQPPQLTGRLGGKRLALADLAPAIGADRPPSISNRVLPDERFDLPALDRMDANVLIDLPLLDFGTPALTPMQALKAHLVLAKGQLKLSDLSARVAGGRLSGATAFNPQGKAPHWSADLKFAGVNLDGWIQGLKKDGQAPNDKARSYMTGTLNATVALEGEGRSVAEILGSANGRLRARVAHGELSQLVTEAAGLDVAQALGMLIKGDEPLKLNCAQIDAVVVDGVVKSRHAVLDNADSTLRVQGGASFKTEALRLRVVSEPKDFSPLSLRSPITVSGQLGQPVVGIEAKGLLARVAGAVLLSAVAPPAALLAFIDTGASDDPTPCAPAVRPAPKAP